jgi:RNA polymerase sigma-70 factor, ECF subfamily
LESFEGTVLVHFDAAYNLARWLTNDEFAAEDAVQEACLRAYRFFGTRHGPNAKAWFLAIVRNVCFDTIAAQRASGLHDAYDEDVHSHASARGEDFDTPESAVARSWDARWLRRCIATLPREYREVIVLRELEELAYKEIGAIVDVPIGTVMSRLARGRELLQQRMQESRRRRDA